MARNLSPGPEGQPQITYIYRDCSMDVFILRLFHGLSLSPTLSLILTLSV